jgi:hypothetical protein
MKGLSGYTQQGLGPQVCVCGFVYPAKPQAEWTPEDAAAVAGHQLKHFPQVASSKPKAQEPPQR